MTHERQRGMLLNTLKQAEEKEEARSGRCLRKGYKTDWRGKTALSK